MALNATIETEAKRAGEALGLPDRLIAAWFIAENGWEWPATNNPGNISYEGEGVPSGGVFAGVTRVDPNHVCEYKDAAAGTHAFVEELKYPKGPDKKLNIDLSDLTACGTDIKKMTEVIGKSNWATSHYDPDNTGTAGILIWEVYQEKVLAESFPKEAKTNSDAPSPASEKTKPAREGVRRKEYTIRKGDTLSQIALDFQTTVRALQYLNGIKDPNVIDAGAVLELPFEHKVVPGDTVWAIAQRYDNTVQKIAEMNHINPDYIRVGWTLYV